MKRQVIGKCIWSALLIGITTIGIPILINELYKYGSGYVTMWEASDVLSYYGTVLGSVIAIATLSFTILFSKKQIQRESYLNSEKEKWNQIESAFSKALVNINPLRPLQEIKETKQQEPFQTITTFQAYQMVCRTAMDDLLAVLNSRDYSKVEALFQKISDISEEYFHVAGEEIAVYQKWQYFTMKNNATRTISIEKEHPNSFSPEDISFYEEVLKEVEGVSNEAIQNEIKQIGEKIVSKYESTYRPLLQFKNATFEHINEEIQANADEILCFRLVNKSRKHNKQEQK